ncbi:MAG: hypothetical protein U9Q74_05335, partial [Gemmatimonadota bacterium]|nr:hypothetical protein [Gemmatimonadota bacterium]
MMASLRRFRRARRAAPALIVATAAFAACSDSLGLPTNYTNSDQAYIVYALSGTDVNAPSGMLFASKTMVRVDGAFQFDIAFDINKDGNAVVLPVNQVG